MNTTSAFPICVNDIIVEILIKTESIAWAKHSAYYCLLLCMQFYTVNMIVPVLCKRFGVFLWWIKHIIPLEGVLNLWMSNVQGSIMLHQMGDIMSHEHWVLVVGFCYVMSFICSSNWKSSNQNLIRRTFPCELHSGYLCSLCHKRLLDSARLRWDVIAKVICVTESAEVPRESYNKYTSPISRDMKCLRSKAGLSHTFCP